MTGTILIFHLVYCIARRQSLCAGLLALRPHHLERPYTFETWVFLKNLVQRNDTTRFLMLGLPSGLIHADLARTVETRRIDNLVTLNASIRKAELDHILKNSTT